MNLGNLLQGIGGAARGYAVGLDQYERGERTKELQDLQIAEAKKNVEDRDAISAAMKTGMGEDRIPTAGLEGVKPGSQQDQQLAQQQVGLGDQQMIQNPEERGKRLLKSLEAGMEEAFRRGRADEGAGYFVKATALRQEFINREFQAAYPAFQASGGKDPTPFFKIYNKWVADGNEITGGNWGTNKDGKRVYIAKIKPEDGEPYDVEVDEDQVPTLVQSLTDPKAMMAAQQTRAAKIFESNLKIREKGLTGETAKNLAAAKKDEKEASFITVKDDETVVPLGGATPGTPVRGAGADAAGVRKDLPVAKEIENQVTSKLGEYDAVSGKWKPTAKSTAAVADAERLRRLNPKLGVGEITEIVSNGKLGKAKLEDGSTVQGYMMPNGQFYAVADPSKPAAPAAPAPPKPENAPTDAPPKPAPAAPLAAPARDASREVSGTIRKPGEAAPMASPADDKARAEQRAAELNRTIETTVADQKRAVRDRMGQIQKEMNDAYKARDLDKFKSLNREKEALKAQEKSVKQIESMTDRLRSLRASYDGATDRRKQQLQGEIARLEERIAEQSRALVAQK